MEANLTVTLANKHVCERIVRKIEEMKAASVEGWIEVHVSKEGRPVSIAVRTVEAIKND
jgi:DNA-binding protein